MGIQKAWICHRILYLLLFWFQLARPHPAVPPRRSLASVIGSRSEFVQNLRPSSSFPICASLAGMTAQAYEGDGERPARRLETLGLNGIVIRAIAPGFPQA
jgi:hypothetical protein